MNKKLIDEIKLNKN